ncbi:MAG: hypothetical protein OQK23_07895 [Rhodospirillales bacterium]|nr:hypothetical protein [Rhodospirillales bacterium]
MGKMDFEHAEIDFDADFGPAASLRRRRLWGAVAIVVVLGFLGLALMMGGDAAQTTPSDGRMTFGVEGSEPPSVLWFLAAAAVVVAVSVWGHRIAGRNDTDDDPI